MKILFIGDIVGSPGRKIVKEILPSIKKEYFVDFCVANAENAANGKGITCVIAQELYETGIDVLTMGNHVWARNEVFSFIESDDKIVRPANFPEDVPGKGSAIITNSKGTIGIINVLGRIYMEPLESPFLAADKEIEKLKKQTKVIIVDMHAEATSEKCAMAWYLDGRVSSVLGTHTHVQTADERIFPCGTSFISDVGMCGPQEGVIGVDKEMILEKFLKHMPIKHELAKGSIQFNAVIMEIDEKSGKTIHIERIIRVME